MNWHDDDHRLRVNNWYLRLLRFDRAVRSWKVPIGRRAGAGR